MTQSEALDILKTGRNCFITGAAGSGKTHLVNEYLKYLRQHGVAIGVTASTGIAATHLGGMTVHSWSGMGIRGNLDAGELVALSDKVQTARRIRDAAVLVVDEVSMLHHFRLDTLDAIARHVRKDDAPFGGLQIVLCGDFFQLPPVSRYGDPESHFIYRSEAWRDGTFTVCYLHENFRQTDDPILSILNEIRSGEVSDSTREELRARYRSAMPSEPISQPLRNIEPTRLYTHNADVDAINDRELAKVKETEFIYEMASRGRKPLVESLKKSCLAPEKLKLKKGARVMCVKNDFEAGYVNGTLGVVVSCGPGVAPVIRAANGRLLTIEPASWTIEDDGTVLAEIVQYPLRLAWAITVHKSQGMSLDAVEVDLSRAFEPGMGYVALSRVRTLAGLSILGMNENAFQVHPEVLEYDRHLRDLSRQAEAILAGADRKEIEQLQKEFLAKVAPLHAMGSKKKGARSRENRISTFQRTVQLIRKGKPLREIAKERDMTVETVIAHIEKLIGQGAGSGGGEAGLKMRDIAYLKYEISPQHFPRIEKALEEVSLRQKDGKPPLLSPVKSKLGPNVSFNEIRLARALLGYITGAAKA